MKVSAALVRQLKREVVFQLRRIEDEMLRHPKRAGLQESHHRFKTLLMLLHGLEHDGELVLSPEPVITEKTSPVKPEAKLLVDDLYCLDNDDSLLKRLSSPSDMEPCFNPNPSPPRGRIARAIHKLAVLFGFEEE